MKVIEMLHLKVSQYTLNNNAMTLKIGTKIDPRSYMSHSVSNVSKHYLIVNSTCSKKTIELWLYMI